ncbi:MAG: hypothetical protein ACO3O2_03320, partial [Candidatus Nanopelagicales bacterium]
MSWTNFSSSFGSSPFGENGNNSESRSLTNYTGSSSVGTVLATLSRTSGTAKTINILQIGVTWTSKSPGDGVVGTTFTNYDFVAAGGTESYSVTSGSLPPGLTLATNGRLSGTPTTLGDYSFVVSKAGVAETTGTISISITGPEVTKVTMCHRTSATTNPYRLITVSVNSIV